MAASAHVQFTMYVCKSRVHSADKCAYHRGKPPWHPCVLASWPPWRDCAPKCKLGKLSAPAWQGFSVKTGLASVKILATVPRTCQIETLHHAGRASLGTPLEREIRSWSMKTSLHTFPVNSNHTSHFTHELPNCSWSVELFVPDIRQDGDSSTRYLSPRGIARRRRMIKHFTFQNHAKTIHRHTFTRCRVGALSHHDSSMDMFEAPSATLPINMPAGRCIPHFCFRP
ncbi:hypothetical protein F5Y18DRAFT_118543 [Xylariaceae sp. FL1019]|nr:hypothetical protein F5Y18DRAFT_118543 [Xylariaceae sp. FL1019]